MTARGLWALICLAYWAGTALAAFDETDVIQIEANASIARDNNLYRLPDADPRLFGISPDRKSDTVRTLGLGLKVDKTISRQRFLADLDVTDISYNRNDNLDHIGQDMRGSWFWRVGNYWDGELGYRRRKYLAGFADTRLTFKDLITSEKYLASGGYQFHPRWRIGAEAYTREATHSTATRRTNDFEGSGVALSLTYRTPAQNTFGAELRRTEGEYPNRAVSGLPIFDSSFTEHEVNALVAWRLSGALRLDGAVGWTERKHENFAARDFSGVTGRLAANWEPTGKIRVRIMGNRDIRSLEDVVSNYVLVNSLTVSPLWAVTSKIALQGDFIYETREYLGDPGIVIAGAQARDDTLKTARLGIIYSPFRYVDMTVSYERGDRRSNQFLNEFDYETWSGTLRVRF
jgi:exopolysaccharide biosynthesis operon protein EpsL